MPTRPDRSMPFRQPSLPNYSGTIARRSLSARIWSITSGTKVSLATEPHATLFYLRDLTLAANVDFKFDDERQDAHYKLAGTPALHTRRAIGAATTVLGKLL